MSSPKKRQAAAEDASLNTEAESMPKRAKRNISEFHSSVQALVAWAKEGKSIEEHQHEKIGIGKVTHTEFLEGVKAIFEETELAEDVKLDLALKVFNWGEYPQSVFLLDITMLKMTELVKFLLLALKKGDSNLAAFKFIDTENNHCCVTIASATGNLELVKFFVEHGLDPNQHDENGSSAFEWAQARGYQDIVNYLQEFQPKPAAAEPSNLPPLGADSITVTFKTLLGSSLQVKMNTDDSVFVMKQRFIELNPEVHAQSAAIAAERGASFKLKPRNLKFLYKGKQLYDDNLTANDFNIEDGASVFVMFHLRS